MKKIILSTIILACSLAVFAQSNPKNIKKTATSSFVRKNAFSLEGAGQNGMGAGFNYQRLIWGNQTTFVSGSVGVGMPVSLQNNAKTSMPTLNQNLLFNVGGKGSYAEIGLGGTFGASFGKTGANSTYSIYPMFGYRFQPSAGRLFLHLYFMPVFGETRTAANDANNPSAPCLDCPVPDSRTAVRPWGGFGAGYSF